MTRLELYRLKSIWGNYTFDYACSLARGRFGELISMWDPNMFVKEEIWCDESFIIVKGRCLSVVGDCFMINIYGPHDTLAKVNLWNKLREFMQSYRGKYILFGYMNEVREELERYGSVFSRSEAQIFNGFINDENLIELPLEDVLDVFPNYQVTALDRLWSDHILILFHNNKSDFGLIIFKIYHSWFLRSDFDDIIILELANLGHNSNGIKVVFHDKLKRLKIKIKQWHVQNRSCKSLRKQELACQLKGIEENIEAGIASLDKHKERSKILHEVADIENFKAVDTVQKARIKWDMEGDENTKCFHGLVKQKRREKFQTNESVVSFSPVAQYGIRVAIKLSMVFHLLLLRDTRRASRWISMSLCLLFLKLERCLSVPTRRLLLSFRKLSKVVGKLVSHEQSAFISGRQILDGLHIALSDAVSSGLIRGIKFDGLAVRLSHLFYADDVVITMEWSSQDMDNIIRVLRVFFLASGLKINIHKSNGYGVGVSLEEEWGFDSLQFKVGCGTLFHFWKDTWLGDHPLYLRYNRLFHLEENKDCLVIDRISNGEWRWDWSRSELGNRNMSPLNALLVEIGNMEMTLELDAYVWSLAKDGMFSVGVTHRFLDDRFLPLLVPSTIWEKMLPQKVNIFLWRLILDRLPRRLNLSS
ncbi:RNA-directed DNA polymerase, eukaryota, reverse transcriptase zinc-binding domain protein [Tanacetum coccineum]